jgi:WD40 repeat protein
MWGFSHAAFCHPSDGNMIIAEAQQKFRGQYDYRIREYGRFDYPEHCVSLPCTIAALAIDKSGKKLALTTDEQHICLRDLANPEKPIISLFSLTHMAATMTPSADLIAICALDPIQGKHYLGLCKNKTVSYIPIRALNNATDTITTAALSTDGSLLAWGSDQGGIGIIETEEPHHESAFNATCGGGIFTALSWSPCKRLLAFGLLHDEGKQIAYCGFISVAAQRIVQKWPMRAAVQTCLFKSRNRLAVSTAKKWLITYEVPETLHLQEDVRPALDALCAKASARTTPYLIDTEEEFAIFKLLSKELQESWLFAIADHLLRR